MTKINVGDRMPDFVFSTPFRKDVRLSDAAANHNTALVFLRYYGCTLCQYDLAQYAENYEKIKAAGGNLLVVLQSDPDLLRQELGRDDALPFEVVCDPKETLYHEFEILPAASQMEMAGPKTMLKIAKVKMAGYTHGRYEGNELQLPATFVFHPDLTVTYAHYAQAVDDIPDADQLAKLLK